jgi:hypothetical protein
VAYRSLRLPIPGKSPEDFDCLERTIVRLCG